MPRAPSASDSRPFRLQTQYWVFLFVAITVILSVVAARRIAEQQQLEEKHLTRARTAINRMAADFERHLDQLAEDAQLLAELLWQTGRDPQYPLEVRAKVLRDGVRALAFAVHYCRGIAFSEDGETYDLALDPTEDHELGLWLREEARRVATVSRPSPQLLGPIRAPDNRPFFVQVQSLPFGLVVAAVDARRLFESLQHDRPPDSRFLLIDSTETLWAGCGSAATCQAITRAEWGKVEDLRKFMQDDSRSWSSDSIPPKLRNLLLLPSGAEMAIHWQPLRTGDGPLLLGLLSALTQLQAYRQAAWWRLAAIVAGMMLSAGIVVVFLWRQRQQERSLHERLRHAEELNRLEHQLVRAEKLATVGVLTAGLAHELGTPLAIIRGRAEMLEAKTHWPETKTILDQSDHIASTLRQVLDFSREQSVVLKPTDVVAALHTVRGLLDFRLRQKELICNVEAPKGMLLIAADPDQLQQVLVNLMMNACDACQPGGTIVLRAARHTADPVFVRLQVIDDGCGIPASQLDAVFDPFFTTKPKGEGTGLGLPVAASIVRNHQGQISISSTEGKGTTVTVLWPIDETAES